MVEDNLKKIWERITKAALRVGRNPEEIELVAVTKTVPQEKIQQALEAGVGILGENRVQEALQKQPLFPAETKWHLIGHLQRNKVRNVVGRFDLIHSLDSFPLALEINKQSLKQGRTIDTLIQVNVAGEASKFGIKPEELERFVTQVLELPGVKIKGLMTIAPYTPNPETVRPVFRRLKELNDQLSRMGVSAKYLSMGMSNDFEVAIEEGANLVRIGSSIFGKRI
jgi:pyridoxal phosphate enzyme (YggS family)